MDKIKEIIARNLKHFREQKGLTQRELAAKLGIRHNTISAWENGANSVDISVLMQICDLLDVDICEMFPNSKNDTSLFELSEREQYIITLFRKLSEEERLKFIGRLELLAELNQ